MRASRGRLARLALPVPGVIAASALVASRALAHAEENHTATWGGWSADPWTVGPLVLGGGLYVLGLRRLWGRAGAGRGVTRLAAGAFAAGLLVAALALLSPLDALAGDLFSVHMIQHALLMLVSAPLIVLGQPATALLWASPPLWRPALGRVGRGWTGALWRRLTTPLGAWIVFLATLWSWHIPALYERALVHDGVHTLQHMSFMIAGLLFWTAVLERPRGAGRGAAFLAIFATAVHSCALGALLTVTQLVWYPIYEERTQRWGLSPLEDQQLGGLVMWVPCAAILVGAAIAVFAGLLREAELRAEAPARS